MADWQAGSIIRQESAEEREYSRYLTEIESRKSIIAELKAEAEELNQLLARFDADYNLRIGPLFLELDSLHLEIDMCERRIALLLEDASLSDEELDERIGSDFVSQRAQIRVDQERVNWYRETHCREAELPVLTEKLASELKDLYKQLAKRFHPDLAKTDDERVRRLVIMQHINDAFRERDVEALRQISHQSEFSDPSFERRGIGEKLVWAIREVSRLNDVIAAIRQEIDVVRESKTYLLWKRRAGGEDVVMDIEKVIKQQIDQARLRLAWLADELEQRVEVHSEKP